MTTGIADIHFNLKYIQISVGDFGYFGNVIVTDQPGSITTQSQRSLSPEYWTLNSRAYHSPHWPIPHWGHSSPGSGGFDGWHHSSAPVENRGSPEVGQGLLSRLLPCDTITSQDCHESHTGKFHHHRKSHWETVSGYPSLLCPLQWRLLPQTSFPSTTTSAMGLRHRSHSGWASASWVFIHFRFQNRRPWRNTSRRRWIKVTSIHQVPLLHQAFSLWPKRTEAYGPI